MSLRELEPILQQRGWQTSLQDLGTANAFNQIEADLANGDAVIARTNKHAVLVRSIERRIGDAAIIFNDPATSQIIELRIEDWRRITGGRTEFLSFGP